MSLPLISQSLGTETYSSEQVFNGVVNGLKSDAVELLSAVSQKARGTAERARRKKLTPSRFIECLEDLGESTAEWKDKVCHNQIAAASSWHSRRHR